MSSSEPAASSSRHDLRSDADYECQFRAIDILGLSLLLCPDFTASLSSRFPHVPVTDRIEITDKYINYRPQAIQLEVEANDLDSRHAWQCIEFELGLDSQSHKAGPDLGDAEVDIQKHNNTIKILREMRALCTLRIRIFETGSLERITRLLGMDQADEDTVRQLHAEDDRLQEHFY